MDVMQLQCKASDVLASASSGMLSSGTSLKAMQYTHIWSYEHAVYPYMVIYACIIPIYGHMSSGTTL